MGNAVRMFVFQPPNPSSYNVTFNNLPVKFFKIPRGKKDEFMYAFHIDCGASQTMLYSHGNAEDLGGIYKNLAKKSIRWQINIFAYEYSGYGPCADREPSEMHLYEDIEAAYSFLVKFKGLSPQSIIPFGRSLGSGPTCHLATKYNFKAIILQSAFASIAKVIMRINLPFRGGIFDNLSKLPNISSKILIIHGIDDGLVPFSHAQMLYNAAPLRSNTIWIKNAGHNNVELVASEEYYSRIAHFLKEVFLCDGSYPFCKSSTITSLPAHRPYYTTSANSTEQFADVTQYSDANVSSVKHFAQRYQSLQELR
ncbi:hypothetical protein IE077_002269 [Cardiosporidium cionae]|uniref:Serine aminopeptidase S33 domain-containing protein n=1 Tax=Cardiosporidium cionae TaxID=476202 RepID=A0ABQ7JB75_9APIC|nr:hypothetical protein IE077_002269 [Cardiosporidium cionae]|eukprot:KAF8821242.1 hypothetical protein IE077_002269 [Cardiosporidium cionae]